MTQEMPNGGSVLDIRGLGVRYRHDRSITQWAVKDVDIHVRSGEIVGIIGESGSGKSTVVRAILDVLPKRSLCVATKMAFMDSDVFGEGRDDRRTSLYGRHIGSVFQNPASSLDPVFTVGYQMSEVSRRHNVCAHSLERHVFGELLCHLDLESQRQFYLAIRTSCRVECASESP